MQFSYLVAAAMAAASMGFVPAPKAAPETVSESAPERASLEIVYADTVAAFACDGCKSSYTDSMEAGDSYQCPNGDSWSFTVGTPTVQDARCVPMNYACVFSGSCTFSRTGTLTFTNSGAGACDIYYRVDDELDYQKGSNGMALTIDSSVACRGGFAGAKDCEYRTIEFYDSTDDATNAVVMSWDVNFCCSRCPD